MLFRGCAILRADPGVDAEDAGKAIIVHAGGMDLYSFEQCLDGESGPQLFSQPFAKDEVSVLDPVESSDASYREISAALPVVTADFDSLHKSWLALWKMALAERIPGLQTCSTFKGFMLTCCSRSSSKRRTATKYILSLPCGDIVVSPDLHDSSSPSPVASVAS